MRADVIEDSATFPHDLARVEGFSATRILRRRILARNPNRDGALEQKCVYYAASSTNPGAPSSELVTLTPCLEPNQPIPFYHPRVRQLAFRYVSSMYGNMLCIYIIPLEDGADATAHEDPNSRLYRTCLALLETVAKRGWGKVTGYKKRVVHDVRFTNVLRITPMVLG